MGKWEERQIKELVEKTKTENPKSSPGSEFLYIDISSIDRNLKKIVAPKLLKSSEAPSRARKSVLPDDVLFATTRPNLQNIAIVDNNTPKQIASTAFCVLRGKKDLIENRFLFNFLLTNEVQELIAPMIRGAQYPAISDKDLLSIKIPLPPLPEQRRIVAKLDALFAAIDRAIGLLEENIAHTQALMGSVLDEEFGRLEESSKVVSISEIADVKGGKRLPKGQKLLEFKTDYPYIRVTDFSDNGTIKIGKLKYISKEIHEQISRYIITNDDLYISIAGTIGKTGIIPKELNGANLTENAARLVYKDKSMIDNEFVYYYTKSDKFKRFVEDSTKQVAQPKLALTRLKEIELALPSLKKQQKIVEKFRMAERRLIELEETQTQKLNNLKSLKSSLLDQAFKGEL